LKKLTLFSGISKVEIMEFYLKIFGAIFVVLISLYTKFCLDRRKLYAMVDSMAGPKRLPIPGLEGIITGLQFAGKGNKGANKYSFASINDNFLISKIRQSEMRYKILFSD
jgi:hypothetical protein